MFASDSCQDLFTNFFFGMVVPEGWWMFCWRNLETKLIEGIWRYQASLSTIYLLGPSLGTAFDKRKIENRQLEFPKWSPTYIDNFFFGTVPELFELNRLMLRYVILVLLVVTTPHGLMTLVSSRPMPLMAHHAWKSWRRGVCATHPCRKQRSCRCHAMCLEVIGVCAYVCVSFLGGFNV